MNRPNQQYQLAEAVVQARRAARALDEYATTSVCLGEEGLFEIRPLSGNNYDVASDLSTCDCPDWLKQEQTGYTIVKCKHIYIVEMALVDPSLPDGIDWGTSKFAEFVGINERTVESLCFKGDIVAFKVNNIWHINPLEALVAAATYRSKMWPYT